jgi:D-Tyr-tRNAtyr deacylase
MKIKVFNEDRSHPFDQYRKNVYSQCGEDGVIEYLLGLANIDNGYFVEFGGWDGRHLSNCAWLADKGWQGCFIEGDSTRYSDLVRNYSESRGVATLNAYVGSTGKNSLDSLLDRVHAPSEITVLSIDIDGNDYHVWDALKRHTPLLCVVEFNPTIPANICFVQDDDSAVNFGNSLAALNELAEQKGFVLVAATDWNGFFMPKALCERFSIPTYTPSQVKSRRFEAAIFHGYNGEVVTAGETQLVWHGVPFRNEEFQILPAELRRIPAGQGKDYYDTLDRFKARRSKEGTDSKMLFQMRLLKDDEGVLSPERVRPLRDIGGPKIFIETGTYLGQTTTTMRTLFEKVVSIELSDQLYMEACKKFADDPGVQLLHGDSSTLLDIALDMTGGNPAMIWLDAHWSGGVTARANQNTPIMLELDSVGRRGRDSDIILIDDVRYFIDLPEGFDTHESNGGYPSLIKLLEAIASLPGNYRAFIAGDVMVAMPQRVWDQVQVSQVVQATMALRLDSSPSQATQRWEEILASATGEERDTLMRLPDYYAHSLQYGIGGHFCYWRGLLHERAQRRDDALADFALARRCGVEVAKRPWE